MIYVKDNNTEYDHENMINELTFKKLFTAGIVPIDSDMAHRAIREAAKLGRVWALEFLINEGVSVNPPCYKQFRRWQSETDIMSPLKIAQTEKHVNVIEVLEHAGAQLY